MKHLLAGLLLALLATPLWGGELAGTRLYRRVVVGRCVRYVPVVSSSRGVDWRTQLLAIAKSREEQRQYLEAIQALGLGYGAGAAVQVGSTVYAQTTPQATQEVDLGALLNMSGRLVQQAQGMASDAHAELNATIENVRSAQAEQARLQAILNAINQRPTGKVSIRATVDSASGGGEGSADSGGVTGRALEILASRCGNCHAKDADRAFRVEDVLSWDNEKRRKEGAAILERIHRDGEGRMPKDAPPLDWKEKQVLDLYFAGVE